MKCRVRPPQNNRLVDSPLLVEQTPKRVQPIIFFVPQNVVALKFVLDVAFVCGEVLTFQLVILVHDLANVFALYDIIREFFFRFSDANDVPSDEPETRFQNL